MTIHIVMCAEAIGDEGERVFAAGARTSLPAAIELMGIEATTRIALAGLDAGMRRFWIQSIDVDGDAS